MGHLNRRCAERDKPVSYWRSFTRNDRSHINEGPHHPPNALAEAIALHPLVEAIALTEGDRNTRAVGGGSNHG